MTGAGRIASTRRSGRLKPEDLKRMGIAMKRARFFLSSGGRPLEAAPDHDRLRCLLSDSPSREHARSGTAWTATVQAAAAPQLEFSFA